MSVHILREYKNVNINNNIKKVKIYVSFVIVHCEACDLPATVPCDEFRPAHIWNSCQRLTIHVINK